MTEQELLTLVTTFLSSDLKLQDGQDRADARRLSEHLRLRGFVFNSYFFFSPEQRCAAGGRPYL